MTEWSMRLLIQQYIKDVKGTEVKFIIPEQQKNLLTKEGYKNLIAGMNQAYNAACHYYFNKGL